MTLGEAALVGGLRQQKKNRVRKSAQRNSCTLELFRTCERIRRGSARARKAVCQAARKGTSQADCTERTTPSEGLSRSRPQGCVSFGLGRRCSGGTAERRETACRRQPAGRCKASATPPRVLPPPLTPWPSQKSISSAAFSNFFHKFSKCLQPKRRLNSRLNCAALS